MKYEIYFHSPFLSKPNLPIHNPIHKSIFSLQKEIQSHARKPVLGFSLPKMQRIEGAVFFAQILAFKHAVFKIQVPFAKAFFQTFFRKISSFQNKNSFLQRFFFQTSHPFCKRLFVAGNPFCKGISGLGEKVQWHHARWHLP